MGMLISTKSKYFLRFEIEKATYCSVCANFLVIFNFQKRRFWGGGGGGGCEEKREEGRGGVNVGELFVQVVRWEDGSGVEEAKGAKARGRGERNRFTIKGSLGLEIEQAVQQLFKSFALLIL